MPSFHHDILVQLFRSRGEVAAALLRVQGIVVEHVRAELGSIDLSQVTPTEYRADAVVVLRDARERAVMGVIVEVQLRIDEHKELTWPVYVTTLRAELGRPVVLLVVTPEAEVADWARTPIALGAPGSSLTPVVIGFDDVPRVRDRTEAERLPELAVLSAMAHPELEVATAAIDAISGLPEDQRALYLDLILTTLPAAVRQGLEAQMMEGYKFTSEFALRHYGQGEAEGLKKGLEQGREQGLEQGREQGLEQGREQGLEQGREQGLEQGREQGLEQGREQGLEGGLRTAVLALARAKLDLLTDGELAAIEAMHDQRALTELITRLGQATSPVEARAALDLALRG